MTGKDVAYYSLAIVLAVATVPMYRYIIERGRAADTQQAVSPPPVVAAPGSVPVYRHGPHPNLVRGVACRNGLLYWDADVGVKPVESAHHFPDAARCEIQAVPVRPDSSPASE